MFSGCLKGRGIKKMGNRFLVCKNEETDKPIPGQVRMKNPPSRDLERHQKLKASMKQGQWTEVAVVALQQKSVTLGKASEVFLLFSDGLKWEDMN